MKKFMIMMEENLRNQIKANAAIKGLTMQDWILEAINEKIERESATENKEVV